LKVMQILLVYPIIQCFYVLKHLLIKKECNIPKTHHGLIQLFSLKYVHEDKFNYNVYKHLANAQSDK